MSPSFNSVVVSLSEVPFDDLTVVDDARQQVVLVVDDDPLVADTLTLIFKRAGFRALTAYNAKGALKITGTVKPDILVSDVDMPAMNGVDLALTVLENLPECRVLLFSGHATMADLASARAAGYDFPLLIKPVHPVEMLKNVAKCLRQVPTRVRVNGSLSRMLQIA